jgi:hypothetical protein
MYIASDARPLAQKLAERLVGDAFALGVWDFSVAREGQWVFVVSNTDWLRLGKFQKPNPIDLFNGPMPLSEAGQNSVRSEGVIRALADKVLVFGPEGYEFLEPYGKAQPEEAVLSACRRLNRIRVVGFRASAD